MENMEKNEIIKNKSKKQIQHGVVALGIVIGIGLVIAGIIFVNYVLNKASDSSLTTSGIIQSGDQGRFSSIDTNTIESVAKKLSPSVVSIIGTAQSQSSFFYDYTETATAGTGVIVTTDGYIITNKHVVENSTNLKMVLEDLGSNQIL
jgi:S1-C subfamily serine protease